MVKSKAGRQSKLKCVLVFFGIDRRLDLTVDSIYRNVIAPASAWFEMQSVGYLWAPERIENPRSGESAELTLPRFNLLPPGDYRFDRPFNLDSDPYFAQLKKHGDFWNDDYRSLGNLYFQLCSLKLGTQLAIATDPDIVIFLRPDLIYHDSFHDLFRRVATKPKEGILLPAWQPHGGLNDRYAICIGQRAFSSYGNRLEQALKYCEQERSPLHSEKFLKRVLDGQSVKRISNRAARVRSNGSLQKEDYSYLGWKGSSRVVLGRWRKRLFL